MEELKVVPGAGGRVPLAFANIEESLEYEAVLLRGEKVFCC